MKIKKILATLGLGLAILNSDCNLDRKKETPQEKVFVLNGIDENIIKQKPTRDTIKTYLENRIRNMFPEEFQNVYFKDCDKNIDDIVKEKYLKELGIYEKNGRVNLTVENIKLGVEEGDYNVTFGFLLNNNYMEFKARINNLEDIMTDHVALSKICDFNNDDKFLGITSNKFENKTEEPVIPIEKSNEKNIPKYDEEEEREKKLGDIALNLAREFIKAEANKDADTQVSFYDDHVIWNGGNWCRECLRENHSKYLQKLDYYNLKDKYMGFWVIDDNRVVIEYDLVGYFTKKDENLHKGHEFKLRKRLGIVNKNGIWKINCEEDVGYYYGVPEKYQNINNECKWY